MQAYRSGSSHCEGGSMQAYRSGSSHCDGGSMQQQQYYKSSSSSPAGVAAHHHQHAAAAAASHHVGGGAVYQQSSFKQSSTHTTLTVFGNDPFCEIMPSSFPPGTDQKVVECFNRIDKDCNGVIDDCELMSVLSSCNHRFSLRTVHLLMYQFTHSNKRRIGPKEFVPLMNCLQSWKSMFQRFDCNRNGSIDSRELGQALNSLGYCVSPLIVNLLVAKFSKDGRCSLQYDNFIECCLTVKGLTETFRARADNCGKATFNYEEFLLNVLPFLIA